MTSATLQLPATATAPGRVRTALRQACLDLPADVLDDAQLLASEVVTNAVTHTASTMVTVAIECDHDTISIAVTDQGTDKGNDADVLKMPARSTTAESGRGLLLLDSMASAWGVRAASVPPGRVVWFRLGLARSHAR